MEGPDPFVNYRRARRAGMPTARRRRVKFSRDNLRTPHRPTSRGNVLSVRPFLASNRRRWCRRYRGKLLFDLFSNLNFAILIAAKRVNGEPNSYVEVLESSVRAMRWG